MLIELLALHAALAPFDTKPYFTLKTIGVGVKVGGNGVAVGVAVAGDDVGVAVGIAVAGEEVAVGVAVAGDDVGVAVGIAVPDKP